MFSLRPHGTRSGARAAVGMFGPLPVMVWRTWIFPVRIVLPSGPTQLAGAVVPLNVGPGRNGENVQKKILKTSEFAPESELSST